MRTNPETQVRCNHPQVSFMYIGKVGEGRSFYVPVVHVRQARPGGCGLGRGRRSSVPADPWTTLEAERESVARKVVFEAFASYRLRIEEGSAENREATRSARDTLIEIDVPYRFHVPANTMIELKDAGATVISCLKKLDRSHGGGTPLHTSRSADEFSRFRIRR